MNNVYKPGISAFLENRNIAVLGYSSKGDLPSNFIYKKLKDNGYNVFAVNPNSEKIKDIKCYPDLKSIPDKIEAAVICTPASATIGAVDECQENGIVHIWMHQGIGPGSVSREAFERAKKYEMNVIPGGCPMMYVKPDFIHRCMSWFKKLPE